MPSYPARDILDVYQACQPETPLDPDDERYVELRYVRSGDHLARIIYRRMRATQHPEYHKHLLTGHRGSGKSTELKQIKGYLEDRGLFCVYFDVEGVLDVYDIETLDVLLAIARVVHEQLNAARIRLPQEPLQALDDWFAEIILTETSYEKRQQELQAGFGVDVSTPALRFLLAATKVIQSGGERRREIRKRLQRELQVFVQRLNGLLIEAQKAVARARYQGLVVIVDGLEKMPYVLREDGQSNHVVFFSHHAETLKKPACHILYTVPISLILNQNVSDAFPDCETLPMVTPEQEGLDKLREIVERRVDPEAVFSEPDTVDRLVTMCGGALRDLLRVIRFACDETDDRITPDDVDRAIQKLVREYDYQVKAQDIPALVDIATTGRLPGDETTARLLHQRLVLEYYDGDGRRRAIVHPAVRQVERVRAALQDAASRDDRDTP